MYALRQIALNLQQKFNTEYTKLCLIIQTQISWPFPGFYLFGVTIVQRVVM